MLISQILNDLNLHHDMPCGGKGICGKCRVKVTGNVPAPTKLELEKLTSGELNKNIRLSCQTYALGGTTIYYNTSVSNLQGVNFGFIPSFEKTLSQYPRELTLYYMKTIYRLKKLKVFILPEASELTLINILPQI